MRRLSYQKSSQMRSKVASYQIMAAALIGVFRGAQEAGYP
jgi:hypothetical protein